MSRWLALVLGSVAGGVARYGFAGLVYDRLGSDFPYGTLAVNLSACFLIGFLDSLAESRFLLGPEARVLLMTGFCGAYSTFSTFMLETSNLLKDGQFARAAANVGLSLAIGFLLFRAGAFIGEL
jgi:CrcB protein